MAFKTNTVGELHDWDNFRAWCVKTLNMHDFEEIAFQQLTELKQTGAVIAYKSKFDVLALCAGVTPQQQLKYWYDGLKPDIVRDTRFDPVTRSKYKSIEDAQAVALAADSFTTETVPHTGNKRKQHNFVADQVDLFDIPSTSRLTDQGRSPLGNHNTGNTTAATGSGFKLFIRGNPQANGSKFYSMLGTNTVKEINWPRQAVAYFQQHSRESPPPPTVAKSAKPAGCCFIKGCTVNHNWRDCPRWPNYIQRHLLADKEMDADLVRSATDHAVSCQFHDNKRRRTN